MALSSNDVSVFAEDRVGYYVENFWSVGVRIYLFNEHMSTPHC